MPRTVAPALAGLLLTLGVQPAWSAPPPPAPDAGSILQQVQPTIAPPPSSTGTGLTIESEGGGDLPPGTAFPVKSIAIDGNTSFDTPTLHALIADAEGKSLTLSQLHETIARITDYYHVHGYPLARAIIPAQTVATGAVRVEVIEARYGKIGLENRSRVKDSLLRSTLAPVQSGQVIAQSALDHTLLLLSDIPGVAVDATLKPGDAVGTSDLSVITAPTPAVTGSAALDNFGNRYTGRTRIGGTANVIDPVGYGDVLSVSGLSSGSGMNYGRLAYDTLLNGAGTHLGASYSALHYRLGDPLSALDAHGTAAVASLWARHPLVRNAEVNLYGQIEYDRLQLHDHIDASALVTDRHMDNAVASLNGDARDALFGGGINALNVALTSGHVGFDNVAAQLADAATVRSAGRFFRYTANLYRLQNVTSESALYLAISGQWADRNLDSSQKLIAGGPYTVRGYDMGAISADSGYLETAEFRRQLGSDWYGQWHALAFLDSAQVTLNKNPWAVGKNTATLSGAGAGLNWTGPDRWTARVYLAARVGPTPALVASTSTVRAWVEISKGF